MMERKRGGEGETIHPLNPLAVGLKADNPLGSRDFISRVPVQDFHWMDAVPAWTQSLLQSDRSTNPVAY